MLPVQKQRNVHLHDAVEAVSDSVASSEEVEQEVPWQERLDVVVRRRLPVPWQERLDHVVRRRFPLHKEMPRQERLDHVVRRRFPLHKEVPWH